MNISFSLYQRGQQKKDRQPPSRDSMVKSACWSVETCWSPLTPEHGFPSLYAFVTGRSPSDGLLPSLLQESKSCKACPPPKGGRGSDILARTRGHLPERVFMLGAGPEDARAAGLARFAQLAAKRLRKGGPVAAEPRVALPGIIPHERAEEARLYLGMRLEQQGEDVRVAEHAGQAGHEALRRAAVARGREHRVDIGLVLRAQGKRLNLLVRQAETAQVGEARRILALVDEAEQRVEGADFLHGLGVQDAVGEDLRVFAQVQAVVDDIALEAVLAQRALGHAAQEVRPKAARPDGQAVLHAGADEAHRAASVSPIKRLRRSNRWSSGPGAPAQVEHRGERARDIRLGALHGLGERIALGEVGGDGAGERAARAVRVRIGDALAGEPRARAVKEEVVGVVDLMAALDEHGAAAGVVDALGGALHGFGRVNLHAGEHLSLRHVRRDHGREREQLRAQRGHGVVHQQPRAAGGDHHGVDDDAARAVDAQSVDDGLDERRRGDHAGLDGVGEDVSEDAVELGGQEVGRDLQNAADAGGVLRGQCGDRAHGVNAVGRHYLDDTLWWKAAQEEDQRQSSGGYHITTDVNSGDAPSDDISSYLGGSLGGSNIAPVGTATTSGGHSSTTTHIPTPVQPTPPVSLDSKLDELIQRSNVVTQMTGKNYKYGNNTCGIK